MLYQLSYLPAQSPLWGGRNDTTHPPSVKAGPLLRLACRRMATNPHTPPILQIDRLVTTFRGRDGSPFTAVDSVSLTLAQGESLGIVGESGCGKTTLGRTILRLIPATSGSVTYHAADGSTVDVLSARGGQLRALRRDMQIVFQDPAGSLNPRMKVWQIVSEPLLVHGLASGSRDLRARAGELLERCGLTREAADRYPHEFSGGQRQRIAIARALATNPRFIVCDEPTSALDVSVQAQIVNLLADLQRDLGLSYLFISHDMSVVSHLCARIIVMRAGKIVEEGPRDRIINEPSEAYTRELIASVPEPVVPA